MSAETKPVLVVLHQENSTPGRVGHYFQSRGVAMDIRRPRYGDPLPDTLADHVGAVIFGGPMSANDPDAFVRSRDRLDQGAAARGEAVPRHLPRRADAGAPARRDGRLPSQGNGRGRLLSDPRHPGGERRGRDVASASSTNGTAKVSTCRPAPSSWPRAISSRSRHSATGRRPTASNSMPRSRTR